MENTKVIGLDFGTLSARAIVVSSVDGTVYGDVSYPYPHGVITGELPTGVPLPNGYALASAADYREALFTLIREVVRQSKVSPQEIGGIGIAATTYTMVPCLEDGTALCEHEEFSREPMAYIKLWKHHGAQSQAQRIQAMHKARHCLPVVERYGGCVNCEWSMPKLLETYEEAPGLFRKTFRFCDLGEWLNWMLIGHPTNSMYTMGFKGMWAPDLGFPADEVLEEMAPGFAQGLHQKFMGPPCGYDRPCGVLSPEAAKALGLPAGIAVATSMGDGSAPGVCIGANFPGAIIITLGTSIAMAFLRKKLTVLTGINGVVQDGIVPGYFSYDAGQPCAGDMLDWFVNRQVPASYWKAAGEQGIHAYLSSLAEQKQPWQNPLIVLDWWNGTRGILNNNDLRGGVYGYSMETLPEDIYGAMVQGMACGSRKIIDHCARNGIEFDRIILCGGIAEKNPFIVRQYSNILGREVSLAKCGQITALSAGILAAAAATGMSVDEAVRQMAPSSFTTTQPDMSHREDYEALYARWSRLHDLLSTFPAAGGTD